MRRTKWLILRTACLTSIAICAAIILQLAGIAHPIGIGWGDGRLGRAYSVGLNEAIVFETLSGVRNLPPGMIIGVDGRPVEGLGVFYSRWSMIAVTRDRQRLPGVYSTKIELRIALVWPLLLTVALAALCVRQFIKQRRADRLQLRCRGCGYDLRATPDRCPECGLVPKTPAALSS